MSDNILFLDALTWRQIYPATHACSCLRLSATHTRSSISLSYQLARSLVSSFVHSNTKSLSIKLIIIHRFSVDDIHGASRLFFARQSIYDDAHTKTDRAISPPPPSFFSIYIYRFTSNDGKTLLLWFPSKSPICVHRPTHKKNKHSYKQKHTKSLAKDLPPILKSSH